MEIKKGKKYLCIANVYMEDNEDTPIYIKGHVYDSENTPCITDEEGDKSHMWDRAVHPELYFEELSDKIYYIKGVEGRGKDVKKKLEEYGGINRNRFACDNPGTIYVIHPASRTITPAYSADWRIMLAIAGTELKLDE